MAKLSIAQALYDAAFSGFSGASKDTFVAIELAETGGTLDTNAHNPGTSGNPENSWGIAQINLDAHPQVTQLEATNPILADGISFNLSNKGTNFTPWSTFNSGLFKHYLPEVQLQDGVIPGTPVGGSGTTGTVGGSIPGGGIGGGSTVAGSAGGVGATAGAQVVTGWIQDILNGFHLPNIVDVGYRALFIGMGAIIFFIGLVMFLMPAIRDAAETAGPALALGAA